MIKTFATLASLAVLALVPAHAQAQTMAQNTVGAQDAATFQASIFIDQTASVEETYKSMQRQTRRACKQQLRSVKSLSTRLAYLRSCQSELMEASIKDAKNIDLVRYHASVTKPAKVQQFAGKFN